MPGFEQRADVVHWDEVIDWTEELADNPQRSLEAGVRQAAKKGLKEFVFTTNVKRLGNLNVTFEGRGDGLYITSIEKVMKQ